MNIADDHKPFSHRVPPHLHLDCPVAATAAADRTDVRLRAGVAAHEPMISWFCGQFDGQSRRTLWQAIRRQTVPASGQESFLGHRGEAGVEIARASPAGRAGGFDQPRGHRMDCTAGQPPPRWSACAWQARLRGSSPRASAVHGHRVGVGQLIQLAELVGPAAAPGREEARSALVDTLLAQLCRLPGRGAPHRPYVELRRFRQLSDPSPGRPGRAREPRPRLSLIMREDGFSLTVMLDGR